MSAAVDQLLKRAQLEALAGDSPMVETAHVALALFRGDAVVSRVLRSLIDEGALRHVLANARVRVRT